MITSFDVQIHIEETATDCPFCDKPLSGEIRDGMHAHCYEQYGEDLRIAEMSSGLVS